MASNRTGDDRNQKASAHIGDAETTRKSIISRGAESREGKDTLQGQSARNGKRRSFLVVDLILVVLIAGVIIGGLFGYRALKNAYAPKWEENVTVYLVVEFVHLDSKTDLAGKVDSSLYLSVSVDATAVGEMTEVLNEGPMPAPQKDTAAQNVYGRVAVKCRARYRAGEGYYVGNEQLLAGRTGVFRLGAYEAEGSILIVTEDVPVWTGGDDSTAR